MAGSCRRHDTGRNRAVVPAVRSCEYVRVAKEERMSRRIVASLGAFALVIAACSSSGGSASPAGSAASPAGGGASPAAASAAPACTEATGSGAVAVSIKDFSFDPGAITAKVGDVIAFTNAGFEPHNATLDAGGCATK